MEIPLVISVLLGIYYVALATLALASIMLSIYTWVNSRRLRNRIYSWQDHGRSSFQWLPVAFVGLSLLAIGANLLFELHSSHLQEAAYLWIGLNWLATARMTSRLHITDNGIVTNVNDPSQTVAWHQINDYLEQERDGYTEFTFFFAERRGGALRSHRIRLNVPTERYETFRRILTYKVDRNLTHTYFVASDKERTS